jgi:hypothetical protein
MNSFEGFAVNNGHIDTEEKCVHFYALKNKISYKYFNKAEDVPPNWIPVGTVDWFLNCTKIKINTIEENYPNFLHSYLNRKIWLQDMWPLKKVFIKPADSLKRFSGFVTNGTYKHKKKPPYICSEVLDFKDEWRYYVDNGKIIASSWYAGINEIVKEAPSLTILNIQFPKNWTGDIDFGMTEKGLTFIEAHPPFAVGNYLGLNSDIYAEWLIHGFFYLKEKYNF